jgi:hypothetical protein
MIDINQMGQIGGRHKKNGNLSSRLEWSTT